jgi:hypothetical protein
LFVTGLKHLGGACGRRHIDQFAPRHMPSSIRHDRTGSGQNLAVSSSMDAWRRTGIILVIDEDAGAL